MRKYHTTFKCNGLDYQFTFSMIIPNTVQAIKPIIMSYIEDVKKSYNISEYPSADIRVNYSDDDGQNWFNIPLV